MGTDLLLRRGKVSGLGCVDLTQGSLVSVHSYSLPMLIAYAFILLPLVTIM